MSSRELLVNNTSSTAASCQTGQRLLGVSLFTGAAIGDMGFQASGVKFIAACELEPDRAALSQANLPGARHFVADINDVKGDIVRHVKGQLDTLSQELFLITCTAPCQGMSKSGQGTLLRNVRSGKRPKLDLRNRLILPALRVISALRPLWVVFENVVEMRSTIIEDDDGRLRPIVDIIRDGLGSEYVGQPYEIEVADFGVPQRRQRLITVYTRDVQARSLFERGVSLVPRATHGRAARGSLQQWVSVTEALLGFPPLDGRTAESACDASIEFHRVPVLDPKKYEWIRHTPRGASAFDNQCANPECGFVGNVSHCASRDAAGINRASKTTPLYCAQCGALLPRPYTENEDGTRRIMSGYTSAYKRMSPDLPAPAITRNLSYPCSDHKIHPTENRVLSLAEAMVVQTISDYDYKWTPSPRRASSSGARARDGLIRLVLGESVPPRFLELLGRHLQRLSFDGDLSEKDAADVERAQLALL